MEKIIEGNKIIARFMGYQYFPYNMEGVKVPGWKTTIDTEHFIKLNSSYNLFNSRKGVIERHYLCRSHNGLSYHKEWSWIMKVVDKIVNMGYEFVFEKIQTGYRFYFIKDNFQYLPCFIDEDMILTIFKGVIEFIKNIENNEII